MPDARGLECWTLIDSHRLFDFLMTCHGTDCEFDTLFLLLKNGQLEDEMVTALCDMVSKTGDHTMELQRPKVAKHFFDNPFVVPGRDGATTVEPDAVFRTDGRWIVCDVKTSTLRRWCARLSTR